MYDFLCLNMFVTWHLLRSLKELKATLLVPNMTVMIALTVIAGSEQEYI